MDDIKLFARIKRTRNPHTGSENIKSGYRDKIWLRKMCHTNNEKLKTTYNGKNRTTKSRKNQNAKKNILEY